MQVIYGQRGQPVASVEVDAVFSSEGTQVSQLVDGYLYKFGDGEWIGSLMSGVVFNAHGAPQGFVADCDEVLLPPMPPTIKAALPPRLRAAGTDVSALPSVRPPAFLLRWLESTSPTAWRDGYFA